MSRQPSSRIHFLWHEYFCLLSSKIAFSTWNWKWEYKLSLIFSPRFRVGFCIIQTRNCDVKMEKPQKKIYMTLSVNKRIVCCFFFAKLTFWGIGKKRRGGLKVVSFASLNVLDVDEKRLEWKLPPSVIILFIKFNDTFASFSKTEWFCVLKVIKILFALSVIYQGFVVIKNLAWL